MKLLVVCDQGNNRSVTLAHQLKYMDHDVLTAGLKTNSSATLDMLYRWADRIITTAADQFTPPEFDHKLRLWNIGPDRYTRPFNPKLYKITKRLIDTHEVTL